MNRKLTLEIEITDQTKCQWLWDSHLMTLAEAGEKFGFKVTSLAEGYVVREKEDVLAGIEEWAVKDLKHPVRGHDILDKIEELAELAEEKFQFTYSDGSKGNLKTPHSLEDGLRKEYEYMEAQALARPLGEG